MGSEIEWLEAVPLIASVDWITAAVIAKLDGHHVPRLPQIVTLLEQRSLRGLGRVKISVEWGGDLHELQLPFERWIRILCGESWVTKETYWYEGERFIARWYFNERHGLEVTYDGGGVGWEGDLHGIDVIAGLQLDGVDLAMLALAAAPPV